MGERQTEIGYWSEKFQQMSVLSDSSQDSGNAGLLYLNEHWWIQAVRPKRWVLLNLKLMGYNYTNNPPRRRSAHISNACIDNDLKAHMPSPSHCGCPPQCLYHTTSPAKQRSIQSQHAPLTMPHWPLCRHQEGQEGERGLQPQLDEDLYGLYRPNELRPVNILTLLWCYCGAICRQHLKS